MKKPLRSSRSDSPDNEHALLAAGLFERAHPAYPAAPRAWREALLVRSIEALSQVPYLHVRTSGDGVDLREMVCVKLDSDGRHTIDSVQSDVRAAWRCGVAAGRTSLHLVRLTPYGFDFRFSLLDEGVFLTGVYEIRLRPDESSEKTAAPQQ